MRQFLFLGFALAAFVWPGARAFATFHFMQIEQVTGGVGGDTTSQAIQLRMRAGGQNFLQQARLRAWDAAGANPVLVINFTQAVANPISGARILVAGGNFGSRVGGLTPDFTMTNLIPVSYLAAGSLTFEDDFGTVIWRLSWGGAGYTGATGGSFDNECGRGVRAGVRGSAAICGHAVAAVYRQLFRGQYEQRGGLRPIGRHAHVHQQCGRQRNGHGTGFR